MTTRKTAAAAPKAAADDAAVTPADDQEGKVWVTSRRQHLNVEGHHLVDESYQIAKADAEKLAAKGTVALGKDVAPENKAGSSPETKA